MEVYIMKVILKVDVKDQGKAGQLLNVSDGYARNFLLPRGLAMEADSQSLNEMKTKKDAAQHKIEALKTNAQQNANKLGGTKVEVYAKGGTNGRLFGSVTTKEIAEAIKKQLAIDIDKRKIILNEDIKAFGTYVVEVKMYPGIITKMNVQVNDLK
jgi:large subunit ribosomal protein L9